MAGWQDAELVGESGAGAPAVTPPVAWNETPISAAQAQQYGADPAGPQTYAHAPADAPTFAGGAPASYVRIDPTSGGYFLRQQAPGGAGAGDQTTAPTIETADAPPLAPASWQSAPVVDDAGAAADKALDEARTERAQGMGNDVGHGAWKFIQGATFNTADEMLGGLAAAKVGIANLTGHGPGYSASDAYKASVQASRDQEQAGDETHPWIGTGLSVLGGAANPLNWVGGEFISGAEGLGGAALRSAGVGAGTGAIYGAGAGDDNLGSRLQGSMRGAQGGAVAGAAVPFVGAALSPVINPIISAVRRVGPQAMATATDALAGLGIDLHSLPRLTQQGISTGVASGLHPADVAIQHAAQSLPVPVPMSRGQITGDPVQQLTENMIYRGGRSPAAARIAQQFKNDQQTALRGNVDQIGADMAGGFPTARGQAGETVSDTLNTARDNAWSGVNDAYDNARAAPNPAYLHPSDALRFARAARDGMADFDPLNVPRVSREVDRLEHAVAPWARDLPPGVNSDRVAGVSDARPADIRTLFEARTRISHLRESNGVEAAAANAVLHKFDQAMNGALTEDLFHGDPKTVQLWKDAIGSRADFGRTFEAGDLVDKLTSRQGIGGNARLKVEAHDASNYIFGRSNIGFVGRQNLYTGLQRLRNVLGRDSDGWNRIRGEAFARIAGAGDGPMEAGTPQFSGAKFAQAWAKVNREDPQLMGTLFNDHERATIDRFAAVAARVTKPVTGGDNASNSGITAARAFGALKRLPFLTIESTPLIDHFAEKIDSAFAQRAIRQATYGATPRRVIPPASAFAGQVVTPPLAVGVEAWRRRPSPQR